MTCDINVIFDLFYFTVDLAAQWVDAENLYRDKYLSALEKKNLEPHQVCWSKWLRAFRLYCVCTYIACW
jgi:hypothetical protein